MSKKRNGFKKKFQQAQFYWARRQAMRVARMLERSQASRARARAHGPRNGKYDRR